MMWRLVDVVAQGFMSIVGAIGTHAALTNNLPPDAYDKFFEEYINDIDRSIDEEDHWDEKTP
jgi:hypothetical protein